MKKEILTFIFNGYADWESAYVCSKLNAKESKYIVKTISFDKEPKISMGGFKVIPDYTVDDYPKEFAMLILIGGDSWIEKKNDKAKSIVSYAVENNIPVAAICGATLILGDMGYLNNIKHTSNTLEFLKSISPSYKGDKNYIEKQAVSDRNIITANGTATLEFTKEIMQCLKVEDEEEINKWYEFHKKGFYNE
ncbi:MAG: glutamine amidotransferase [Clostridiaceae bacterium]|nr:glutamine amidotransferase [Clostridiaceae bacterium]